MLHGVVMMPSLTMMNDNDDDHDAEHGDDDSYTMLHWLIALVQIVISADSFRCSGCGCV